MGALLCLVSVTGCPNCLQFSFLQRVCFCRVLKATGEIHTTARYVVTPSCFSFAYLKGSSLSYWAINRKTSWLHLWLLLCRSNITAAVIVLCMWSLRKKKEKSKTKAAGSRVLKESRNLPTLQPAGCSFGRLSKFHCIKLRVERKKITRATAQDKREDKAKKYKGKTQSSSLSFTLQQGCHSASRQHLSPNMGWTSADAKSHPHPHPQPFFQTLPSRRLLLLKKFPNHN